ncbi:hypothetical protein ACHQM5_000654 [Ranunculus cassubicifolius]
MLVSHTSIQLPVLDISKPLNASYLSSLREACQEWGFFYITNHGISKDLYREIYSLSNQLFNFPTDAKLKLGPLSSIKSYTPHFIASPFYESFRVFGPNFSASAKCTADVLFDPPNTKFSETLQEYGNKMVSISQKISEALLECLGDDICQKYSSEFCNCHGYLRIINYSSPSTLGDGEVEGLGKHTDMSCITVLYPDEIGGLQVRSKEGKWIDIDPCEGALVVNVGDMLEAWSNGKLRSSEHRVVLRKSVNRLSLAFFWCFEDEKVISAPDEVVGNEYSRNYKPFVCSDYLRFRETSETGKFEMVGFTVKGFAGVSQLS